MNETPMADGSATAGASTTTIPRFGGVTPDPGYRPTNITARRWRRSPRLTRLVEVRNWSKLLSVADFAVLLLSAALAVVTSPQIRSHGGDILIAIVFTAITTAVMHRRRSSDHALTGTLLDVTTNALGAISSCAVVALALADLLQENQANHLAIRLWIFASVLVVASRLVLQTARRELLHNQRLRTPTLIVGAGRVGVLLAERLGAYSHYGLRPAGFLDSDPLQDRLDVSKMPIPVLGGPEDLEAALKITGAQRVILAFSNEPDSALVEVVNECQRLDVAVSVVPRLFEQVSHYTTIDHVHGLPLLSWEPTDPLGWRFTFKHVLDRVTAAVALFVLSPLMIGLAIAVWRSSPGPVLFRQRRIGRDGREFEMLKFRTMKLAPDVAPEAGGISDGVILTDFDRRTRIGKHLRKLSLDELPQLLNVLLGDMSIVGPRPERTDYVNYWKQEISRYDERHRVKAGMTGLAQVNGLRGETSVMDRVELDRYYIRNWSLKLDFRIVLMTVNELFRGS